MEFELSRILARKLDIMQFCTCTRIHINCTFVSVKWTTTFYQRTHITLFKREKYTQVDSRQSVAKNHIVNVVRWPFSSVHWNLVTILFFRILHLIELRICNWHISWSQVSWFWSGSSDFKAKSEWKLVCPLKLLCNDQKKFDSIKRFLNI